MERAQQGIFPLIKNFSPLLTFPHASPTPNNLRQLHYLRAEEKIPQEASALVMASKAGGSYISNSSFWTHTITLLVIMAFEG